MTSKEKALELVNKFREFADGTDLETDRFSPRVEKEKGKQCALIAVDEVLNAAMSISSLTKSFWHEVKREIKDL